jgi:hypothetical protein
MPTLDDKIGALQNQFEAIAKIGQRVYSSPSNPYLLEAQAGANEAPARTSASYETSQGKREEFNSGKP